MTRLLIKGGYLIDPTQGENAGRDLLIEDGSVRAMPNTDPVNDNPAVTRFIIEQAERARLANVFPIGAITKASGGAELAEMGEMKRAGIVAVSDDGRPVPSASMMRRAMEYARGFNLPVIDHCDDK